MKMVEGSEKVLVFYLEYTVTVFLSGDGTLLIWMRNYEKFLNITDNFTLCGETYYAGIKVLQLSGV